MKDTVDNLIIIGGEELSFDLKEDKNGNSYYAKHFSGIEYIGEFTLACKFSTLTLAAWADYYSSHKSSVNVGLTLGWFMFNERFIE